MQEKNDKPTLQPEDIDALEFEIFEREKSSKAGIVKDWLPKLS